MPVSNDTGILYENLGLFRLLASSSCSKHGLLDFKTLLGFVSVV